MLRDRVLIASFWSVLDVLGRQIVQIVVTLFLARLLTPSDFGVIALLTLVAGLAGLLVDSGFSYALIQRKDIDHQDESSVFWFNLIGSVALAGLLLLFAPQVAAGLSIDTVAQLIPIFACGIVVSAATSVQIALLTKRMSIGHLASVNASAAFGSGVLAVVLAMRGWGVWSLAWQYFVSTLITSVLIWLTCDWKPELRLSWHSLKKLFPFGGLMFLSVLLDKSAYTIQGVMIGRLYGPHDVGVYARAESALNYPLSLTVNVASKVAFPLFSHLADDQSRLVVGARKAMRVVMFANAPLMMGLMAVAPDAIRFLLGSGWEESANILIVLCWVGLFWPLQLINLNILSASGRSDLILRVELLKKVIAFALIIIASPFGIVWIAWAQVVLVLVSCGIAIYASGKITTYKWLDQVGDCFPPLACAGCMGFILAFARNELDHGSIFQLGALIFLGAGLYSLIHFVLKTKSSQEVWSLVKSKLRPN